VAFYVIVDENDFRLKQHLNPTLDLCFSQNNSIMTFIQIACIAQTQEIS